MNCEKLIKEFEKIKEEKVNGKRKKQLSDQAKTVPGLGIGISPNSTIVTSDVGQSKEMKKTNLRKKCCSKPAEKVDIYIKAENDFNDNMSGNEQVSGLHSKLKEPKFIISATNKNDSLFSIKFGVIDSIPAKEANFNKEPDIVISFYEKD